MGKSQGDTPDYTARLPGTEKPVEAARAPESAAAEAHSAHVLKAEPEPPAKAAPTPRPSAEPRRRAVLVAHGMGQQQPFDTLVSVAEGLLAQAEHHALPPQAVRVQLGSEQLARLELALPHSAGGPLEEVHLYEAYWAPLTEGRVTLRDVMGFLLSAGWKGFRNAQREDGVWKFKRWVFGALQTYRIPGSHLGQLLGALLVIASLVAINACIVAVTAHSALFAGSDESTWPSAPLLAELSGLFHLEFAFALLFTLTLVASTWSRASFVNRLQRLTFGLLLVGTVGTARTSWP